MTQTGGEPTIPKAGKVAVAHNAVIHRPASKPRFGQRRPGHVLRRMFWAFFIGRVLQVFSKVATNLSETAFHRDGFGARKQLEMLIDAGHALSSESSPRAAFEQVLQILAQQHGVIRGTVTLLDPRSSEIHIEVSC